MVTAFHQRLPAEYVKEHLKRLEGVDGTKTPKEKWFKPDEGVLPEPLSQERIDEVRNGDEERKEMLRKMLRDGTKK